MTMEWNEMTMDNSGMTSSQLFSKGEGEENAEDGALWPEIEVDGV